MKGVGLLPNWDKEHTAVIVQKIDEYFSQHRVPVKTLPRNINILADNFSAQISSWKEEVEVLIVVGGDGTILRVARELFRWKLPILGINAGHKGFLAEIELNNLEQALNYLLQGSYHLNERIILQAEIERSNQQLIEFVAVNDVVVSRGPFSRIIALNAYINQEYLETYSGDGLVVATPTGSTAYSLSAGGPIIHPNLEVLVVTPICPHSLYSRSVIVDSSETISVEVTTSNADIVLTMDGQVGFNLKKNDRVRLSRAHDKVKLITFPYSSFYNLLHHKLKG